MKIEWVERDGTMWQAICGDNRFEGFLRVSLDTTEIHAEMNTDRWRERFRSELKEAVTELLKKEL